MLLWWTRQVPRGERERVREEKETSRNSKSGLAGRCVIILDVRTARIYKVIIFHRGNIRSVNRSNGKLYRPGVSSPCIDFGIATSQAGHRAYSYFGITISWDFACPPLSRPRHMKNA